MTAPTLTDPTTGQTYQVVGQMPSPDSSPPPDGGTSAPPPSAPAPEGAPPEPAVSGAGEGGGKQPPAPSTPAAGEVTPAPAPAAPQEPAPFAAPADEAAAVERLDSFLQEEITKATATVQSKKDGEINALKESIKKDREAQDARQKELQEQVRNLQLQGLQPEEQERLKRVWEQDDKSTQLTQREKDLDEWHRSLVVADALQHYGQFGVEEGDLQGLSPEEVTLFCAEAKAAFYEEKAKTGVATGAPPVTAPVQQPAPAPATPAPQGAHAPSDVGGGGGGAPPVKFREDKGDDAMSENLANMPWQTVQPEKRQ